MRLHALTKGFASVLLLIAAGLCPVEVTAQSMADYTSGPVLSSGGSTPNILLVFDNSGSMQIMAFDGQTFSNSNTYTGMFDPTECYWHNTSIAGAGGFEAEPAANGTTPPASCPQSGEYMWSGNVLNFVSMRRIDVAKQVMIGGNCRDARDAQDLCTTVIEGQNANLDKGNKQISLSVNSVRDLIPLAIIIEADNKGVDTLFFLHFGDTTQAKAGWFCVDDDGNYPPDDQMDCSDGSDFSEGADQSTYRIALKLTAPSGGVLQDIGDRARFAMMIYAAGEDGGPLTADMGISTTDLVDQLNAFKPPGGTGTPLAEVLYEAARYYAQIAPSYTSATPHYTHTVTSKDPYYFAAPQWPRHRG